MIWKKARRKSFESIWVHGLCSHTRNKLDKKSEKLWFVGYSIQSKGYRLLNESQKVIVRRDVVFNESDFGHAEENLTDKLDVDVSHEEASAPEVEQQQHQHPQRQRKPVWSR